MWRFIGNGKFLLRLCIKVQVCWLCVKVQVRFYLNFDITLWHTLTLRHLVLETYLLACDFLLLACDCNNHSVSCSYNKTLGYGSCNECLHGTAGDKCELCKHAFYRNVNVSITDVRTCLGNCMDGFICYFAPLQ